MNARDGVTLIELLVVIVILAAIVAAIGACLAGGIRVWEAAKEFNGGEVEASIGLAMMERDFANSYRFFAIGFKGSQKEMSFPHRGVDPADPVSGRIGAARYFFDPAAKSLFRQTWRFPGKEPERAVGEKVAGSIEDLTFQYTAGNSSGSDAWLAAWNDPTNMPRGIRVEALIIKKGVPAIISRILVNEVDAATNSPGGVK